MIVRTDARIPVALRLQRGKAPADHDAVVGFGVTEAAAAELALMATTGIECADESVHPSRPHDWGLPAENV